MTLGELACCSDIVIQCHDAPDADAIASAFALLKFLESRSVPARLIYSGRDKVSKPNLTLMLKLLNIPLEYADELPRCGLLVTVDCQYGAGNVRKFGADRVAVFDHHVPEIPDGPDVVINPSLGSCSTLIWDLMTGEGFDFAGCPEAATALHYGLFADTNGFSETRHPKDRDLADFRPVDLAVIKKLVYSALTMDDLKTVANSLSSPRLVGRAGLLEAAPCDANLLGFASDVARQVEQFDCCVVYCPMPSGIKLSIRSSVREVMAQELAEFLTRGVGSGGGGTEKAGGFIGYAGIEKTAPGITPEKFLTDRIEKYQANFDHVYWNRHNINFASMRQFRKPKIQAGFARSSDVFPGGTPITVRTLEGDVDTRASSDIYFMIGPQGEVYPIKRSKHERDYDTPDVPYQNPGAAYTPAVINRISGAKQSLVPFARACVPKSGKLIRAAELARDTKVFTLWDEEKYYSGRAGDYIAASEPTEPGAAYDDVYVIRRGVFEKTYEPAEPD